MTHAEIRGFKKWEEQYKPIKNHLSEDPDEITFETYGQELDFVEAQDPKKVWTYQQGDESDLLRAGFHFVNRIRYYIASVPWENEDDYVLVSIEEHCECYKEEGHEDGEYGKADCQKCEGTGYFTKVV